MNNKCTIHENHSHQHGANCGHTAVRHGDHVDYLHDGHLHHIHENHVDEHIIEVSETNPDRCMTASSCGCPPECTCSCVSGTCTCECGCAADEVHARDHIHGPDCGHEAVPHGDHIDYLVNGRLHHQHGNHCDDHGPLEVVS